MQNFMFTIQRDTLTNDALFSLRQFGKYCADHSKPFRGPSVGHPWFRLFAIMIEILISTKIDDFFLFYESYLPIYFLFKKNFFAKNHF